MTGERSETRSAVIVGSTTLPIHCAQRLIDSGHSIVAVLPLDAVMERWAAASGLRCVASLDALAELLRDEPADWLFSIVNPLLLPASLVERCRLGAINYHDGPLPRYAGSHATFWALLAGETQHAVTWHHIASAADAGDILVQTTVDITPAETSLSLNLKCFQAAADSFGQVIEQLSDFHARARPQDLRGRTFFPRRRRPHGAGLVQWNSSADELAALARALDFGAHFFNPLCTMKVALPDRVIQLARVDVLPHASTCAPGTVVAGESDGLRISTATNDVLIGGLSSLTGQPLEWSPRPGDALPLLTAAELTAFTRVHEEISGAEPFWRERLQRFHPLQWPLAPAQQTTVRRDATAWLEAEPLRHLPPSERVTRAVAAFALHVARVLGREQLQFGFEVHTNLRGCLASTVPAELSVDRHASLDDLVRAVESELAMLAGSRTFAVDLIARAPELRAIRELHGRPWPIAVDLADDRDAAEVHCDLLTLQIAKRDGSFRLVFDASRLTGEQVQRSADELLDLLRTSGSPEPLAGGDEWSRNGVAGPDADYPRDRCVHQLFAEQARARPEAPAILDEDSVMTYGELDRRSAQLAAFLSQNGIGPGSLVGIYVHRSAGMLVALLGVMRSGAAYVPMDPVYPRDRIAYMIDDAALPMLLTDSRLRAHVPECSARVVSIDEIPGDGHDENDKTGDRGLTPGTVRSSKTTPLPGSDPTRGVLDLATSEGTAYVIYTSGSTGRPKGVKVGHRALTNLLSSMASTLGTQPADKLLAVTTICFDIAGLELYLPLVTGGVVEIATAAVAADGVALRGQLERSRPAFMQATPATWKMLLQAGWMGDPHLTILCGGEALPRDLADALVSRGRAVWNLYGPTETTIWSSMSRIERGGRITIGRPIVNTRFHFLDERLQPGSRGAPAELFISGDGVAEGYLGRPELTAERFLPCPFGAPGARMYRTGDLVRLLDDGTVEYLQRVDRQTKLHGYRIEPGEIEFALRQHASVHDAVVVVREDTPGDARLVAYVEAHAGEQPPESELRRHLNARLPVYEVPAAFVLLKRIPRTPNGKIDHATLPQPPAAVVPVAPRQQIADDAAGDLEHRIGAIWSDILGRDTVGVNESFFDAGGTSLLLMETLRRLQDATGRPITSTEIFANPTVRTMAAFLAGKTQAPRRSEGFPRDTLGELRRKRLALRRAVN